MVYTAAIIYANPVIAGGPPMSFFRAHPSDMVNTAFVRKLAKDDGDCLLMTEKPVVPLARRREGIIY